MSTSDVDIARDALAHLSATRASDQSLWLATGMAARSVSDDLRADFHAFSQRCPEKYDEREVDQRWKSFPSPNGHPELAKLIHWAKQDSPDWGPSANGQQSTGDLFQRVAAAKRITVDAMLVFGAKLDKRGKLDVVRFPVHNAKGEAHSYFDLLPDVKGWFAKGEGTSGLFLPGRLPAAGETWHLVEGVKDACALHGLGLLACGLPGSAMAARFGRVFRRTHVLIVPDRDRAGVDGGEKTASRLQGVASSVRVVTLPAEFRESRGPDVRDVLAQRDGEQLVRQAIADAVEWKPPSRPPAQEAPARSPEAPRPLTDLGNGERFSSEHSDSVKRSHEWKKWLIWSGTHWSGDRSSKVGRLAKQTVRRIYAEAAAAIDDGVRKAIARHATHSEDAKRIKAMLELAGSEASMVVTIDQLDRDPWLFNVANGTIELKTGRLREHRREDFITKSSPIDYPDEDGVDCPLWMSFLDRIFDGKQDLIDYLQRLVGSSMVGKVFDHALPVFWGDGANGKTTLINALLAIFGEYGGVAPDGFLMWKRVDAHPTEMAALFGKRLVVASETEQNSEFTESRVKRLTGGDPITARRMREDFWTFDPSHQLLLITNHKPRVRNQDHGIWRRLKLIPFGVTIPDHEQDDRLGEKLQAEYPAILRWCVTGCLLWQREGLKPPEDVVNATEAYKVEQDMMARFVSECCLVGPSFRVRATPFYSAYRTWCETNGEHAETQTAFGNRMTRMFEKTTSNGIWYVRVGLRED